MHTYELVFLGDIFHNINVPILVSYKGLPIYDLLYTLNWNRGYFHLAFSEFTLVQVDLYLLPQVAFPTGGLYFKNQTWVQETKGLHVIIHNNYITGFEKKIKRFRDFGLWFVDDYAVLESPLGRI